MLFSSWLRNLRSPWARSGLQPRRLTPRRRGLRLAVEQLENRLVPSSFSAANVSDLIADINAANRAGGTNTITLTAPTNSPYILTAIDNTTDGATGLPVIAANDNLTILGNGDTVARSTATGTPAFRLLDVAGLASLTLQNLTLQGGLALGYGVSAEGGGIYSQGSLDLNGVTVQNNTAQGRQAGAGGGIWSSGALTLEGGTKVQDNLALAGLYNGCGGGLYVAGGTVTLTNTAVSSNTAQGGQAVLGRPLFGGSPPHFTPGGNGLGGGLYVAAGTVTLTGDTLGVNTALGGPGLAGRGCGNGFGGGLYAAGGTITLLNDAVTGNAANGGASQGVTGLGEGGGLYMAPAATVYLDAFTVANILNNAASTIDPNIHGSYNLLP
jgi:hypothetical protein